MLEETGEIVEAATFEGAAEGDVFEPAIRASYEIEVGDSGSGQRHRWLSQLRAMRLKLDSSALVRGMAFAWFG